VPVALFVCALEAAEQSRAEQSRAALGAVFGCFMQDLHVVCLSASALNLGQPTRHNLLTIFSLFPPTLCSMMYEDDKLRVKQDPLGFLKDNDAVAHVARSTQSTVSAVSCSSNNIRRLTAHIPQQQQQQQRQLALIYVRVHASSCRAFQQTVESALVHLSCTVCALQRCATPVLRSPIFRFEFGNADLDLQAFIIRRTVLASS
jgi:hypothetical protein